MTRALLLSATSDRNDEIELSKQNAEKLRRTTQEAWRNCQLKARQNLER